MWLLASACISHMTSEEFGTFIKEIEVILNNRPMISTHDNASDLSVITPMSLFLLCLPMVHIPNKFVGPLGDRMVFHHVQRIADMFWGDFYRLYLLLLNCRHKWLGAEQNLKVGDLVMVNDNSLLRRHCWPLARVVHVIPYHYDRVCQVEIRRGFPVVREYELDI